MSFFDLMMRYWAQQNSTKPPFLCFTAAEANSTVRLTAAKSVLGVMEPLILDAAPTTSTVGKIGQLAVDTTTSTPYICVAITVDETDPQNPVTTYTWKEF